MGISVEMVQLPYQKLKVDLIKKCKVKDEEELEKILNHFGVISGGSYFLLDNEYYEEYNSYFELPKFLNAFYKVYDTFDIILNLNGRENFNVNATELAEEEYGFEVEEDEDGQLTFSKANVKETLNS